MFEQVRPAGIDGHTQGARGVEGDGKVEGQYVNKHLRRRTSSAPHSPVCTRAIHVVCFGQTVAGGQQDQRRERRRSREKDNIPSVA